MAREQRAGSFESGRAVRTHFLHLVEAQRDFADGVESHNFWPIVAYASACRIPTRGDARQAGHASPRVATRHAEAYATSLSGERMAWRASPPVRGPSDPKGRQAGR